MSRVIFFGRTWESLIVRIVSFLGVTYNAPSEVTECMDEDLRPLLGNAYTYAVTSSADNGGYTHRVTLIRHESIGLCVFVCRLNVTDAISAIFSSFFSNYLSELAL